MIILTQSQRSFLIEYVLKHRKELITAIEVGISVHDKWHVDVNDDIINEVRDECLAMLQVIGFDRHYELTEQGHILEELIDILYK